MLYYLKQSLFRGILALELTCFVEKLLCVWIAVISKRRIFARNHSIKCPFTSCFDFNVTYYAVFKCIS